MNPINHTGWPLIAEKDVKKHVYDLRSLLYQVYLFIYMNFHIDSTIIIKTYLKLYPFR